MVARGHRVQLWAVAGSAILAEAATRGLPHRALPIGRKNLRGVLALRRALVEERPDVINTHSSTDTWLTALASLSLRSPPPLVRTRHISAPVPMNAATRWLYMCATRHIVTTGEYARAALIRDNGFDEGRITSVPTGVDPTRFHPGDKSEARRLLKLDPSARYIGIVATLRSWKGHLYLLDAFARLVSEDPALKLVIVGDGPMQDVIAQRIAELGLVSKVIMPGREQAVERWFQVFDVFCLPSYANEGVPQALVQAMLTGLPIVTTTAGSIGEAVVDGVTAIIVPPKNVERLAAGLQRALADGDMAARMGAAARADALKHFSLETMLTRMEEIFHRNQAHTSSRGG